MVNPGLNNVENKADDWPQFQDESYEGELDSESDDEAYDDYQPAQRPCVECDGTGLDWEGGDCPHCDGYGYYWWE